MPSLGIASMASSMRRLPRRLHGVRFGGNAVRFHEHAHHYGLLANGNRKAMVAKARALLAMAPREAPAQAAETTALRPLPCCCPRCGGRMIITMLFVHSWAPDPRAPPASIVRLDTS